MLASDAALTAHVRVPSEPQSYGGRWRGASTGVDRRAQLWQLGHAGDRHGLVLVEEPVSGSDPCAPPAAAGARPRAERLAGVPGNPEPRTRDGPTCRRRRRALDPIEPDSAAACPK
jgi:hypothetical protein